MIRKILVILISASLVGTCRFNGTAPAHAASDTAIPVRVNIREGSRSVDLDVLGGYTVFDAKTGKEIMRGRWLHSGASAVDKGIYFAGRVLPADAIRLVPSGNLNFYLDERSYRGELTILKAAGGTLLLINQLDIEEYLLGVLPHEVSPRWPIESLKAQAIVARTFALYQKRQNRNQDYDVRSDVKSQIYAGCTAEKWSTNRAVRLTRHEVLTYKGEILPSYYHATCAGHTEDAANLWDVGLGLEPLKGVACPFCKASPHYRWSKELSLKDLKAALENAGYHIEAITSIGVAARNKSGRVDKLEIKDAGGVTTLLTAKDFRAAVGPNEIRSANFDVKVSGDYAIFWGFGWGHGVGMCQWGAYGMACKGYKAEGILRYYYPGAEISTIEQVAERL